MVKPLLSVQDLKVHFIGDETVARALDGVSYDVREGETVCIVGESGCGKTVSALSILGLIPQPPGKIMGGKIFFNGRNLLDLDEDEMQGILGNQISMVFQEPMTSLNPVFTIEDQLQEAMIIHEELDVNERHHRSIQLLKDVGIASPEERIKDYPHQLSGGQRQRVMIAMSLACNPDLVIADEPTASLDPINAEEVMVLFTSLTHESGVTLIIATHEWERADEHGFRPIKFNIEQNATQGTVRAWVSG